MTRLLVFISLITLGTTACQSDSQTRDIRNYYFPLKQLTEGMVYEYQAVNNDSLVPEYWYYRSLLPGDSIYLSATFYGGNLLPQQQMTQRMTSSGMVLKDMYLYEADSTREDVQLQIPVQVVADDVFPFYVRDSGGIFLYHVRWELPQQANASMRLIKNRRYTGDTSFQYRGKTYPAVRFDLRELLEYDREGVLEQEYTGTEIYAKGLGLVYYRKEISDQFQLEYRLADRYPMEQLEAKFRSYYGIKSVHSPDLPINTN